MKKTVAFHTLGCKVNQYETEAMQDLFKDRGYEPVDWSEVADVYVVNTCTVTNIGDRKSRQFLRQARAQNPLATVVAVGCYAQVAEEELAAIEEVDLILGTKDKKSIVDWVESDRLVRSHVQTMERTETYEDLSLNHLDQTTRAFIKVQDGCDQYCSYCIIPYARGPIRSRPLQSVLEEVRRLGAMGVKEFVMTGIHIASYGRDLEEDVDLMDLLEAVDREEGVKRLRLSSLEPRLISEAFVERLAALETLAPHFHLSLQSGDDGVLAAMNRRYDRKTYAAAINRLREAFDRPAITTDVIVGFPGESDEAFENTLSFARELDFFEMHVFKYSPKKGTPAAKAKDQIAGQVKTQRSKALLAVAEECRKRFLRESMGKKQTLLIEKVDEEGVEGYTEHYLRLRLMGGCGEKGDLVKVVIEEVRGEELLGRAVEE